MAKQKKEKNSIKLPKAWASMKHRNETAQARTDLEGLWSLIIGIIAALAIAFVLLGGVSQTGVLKFAYDWSRNVGEKISGWMSGGGVIVNDDGIYIDPSGKGETLFGNYTDKTENSTSEEPTTENTSEEITESTTIE